MKMFLSLLFSGALLLTLEVFVPGGIVGCFGILCLLLAAIHAITAIGGVLGYVLAISVLVFGGLMLYLVVKILPSSFIGKRMALAMDLQDSHAQDTSLTELRNKSGIATTHLRPAGFAEIEGRRIDVVTRGEAIEANEPISVVEVEGNRVVVARISQSSK